MDQLPDRNVVIRLGFITLVGMSVIAIIIDRFSETVALRESILGQYPIYYQIPIGLVIGVVFGFIAEFVSSRKFMDNVRMQYATVMRQIILTRSDAYFISFCAGVGEEMLFRGALQPFGGIIFTALLFVGIHGYLDPRKWQLMIYGLVMTGLISIIGWMSVRVGLVSAMVAHMFIDVVLLEKMRKEQNA